MNDLVSKQTRNLKVRNIFDLAYRLHTELKDLEANDKPCYDALGVYVAGDVARIRDRAELLLDLASCEKDCKCHQDPDHGMAR